MRFRTFIWTARSRSHKACSRSHSEQRQRCGTHAWTQKWSVHFFGIGLIYPRAQTCMDSKVVRADFGSGLICPRAQTCCAELRRLARLANSPGFKSFRCPRERIKFSLERFSDQSRLRAQPLESSLGRVPQAADCTCNKISQTRSCRSPRTV